MEFVAPLSVADRIALTLGGLGRAVAARIAGGAMQAAMIVLIWRRIRRVEGRVLGLLARFQAGRLRAPVVGRVGVCGGQAGAGAGVERLPLRFGWLLPLVPFEAAGFASQMRAVLAEPEMVALLGATPQARRVLAPLCRMLGIEAEVLAPAGAGGGAVEVSDPVEMDAELDRLVRYAGPVFEGPPDGAAPGERLASVADPWGRGWDPLG